MPGCQMDSGELQRIAAAPEKSDGRQIAVDVYKPFANSTIPYHTIQLYSCQRQQTHLCERHGQDRVFRNIYLDVIILLLYYAE